MFSFWLGYGERVLRWRTGAWGRYRHLLQCYALHIYFCSRDRLSEGSSLGGWVFDLVSFCGESSEEASRMRLMLLGVGLGWVGELNYI